MARRARAPVVVCRPSPVFRFLFLGLDSKPILLEVPQSLLDTEYFKDAKVEDERGYNLISFHPSCTQHDAGLKLAGRD
jgi:hypothetical protein